MRSQEGQSGGGGLQLGGPLGVDDQVDEGAAVGGDQVIRQCVPPGGWLEGGPAAAPTQRRAEALFALAGILQNRRYRRRT